MTDRTTMIAGLILERPLCVDCVALKCEMSAGAIDGYLAVMERVVRVRRETDRCRACGITTAVVSTLV